MGGAEIDDDILAGKTECLRRFNLYFGAPSLVEKDVGEGLIL